MDAGLGGGGCFLLPTCFGMKGAWQQISLSVVWLGVSGERGLNLPSMESLLMRDRSAPRKLLAISDCFPARKCLGLAVTWDHSPF